MREQIVISTPVSPATAESLIQQLYVAYFNRPADPGGLNYWKSVFLGGDVNPAAQYLEIARLFSTSAEYISEYQGLSSAEVVDHVYLNLFGRHAEAGGLLYWANLLEHGQINVANVVIQVAGGAQGSDLVAFHDKALGAAAFTRALDTPVKVAYYDGAIALIVAKNFIGGIVDDATLAAETTPEALQLTIDGLHPPPPPPPELVFTLGTGADLIIPSAEHLLQGADTFNARSSGANETLNAGDIIDGGNGIDTLNIISTTGSVWSTPANIAIRNIEKLNLSTDKAATVDAAGWSSVLDLSVSAVGNSSVNALSATNISLTAVQGSGSATVNGGHNVNVSVSGSLFGTGGVNIGSTVMPSGVITLNYAEQDTGGSGLLYVAGGTEIHVGQTHAHGLNTTALNAPVTVQGGSLTSVVTVNNAAAATASATVAGVQTNRVTINDANSTSLTDAGHIVSVSVNHYSALAINDNALVTLSLAGGSGDVSIVNGLLQTPVSNTLQLNLDGVLRGTLDDSDIYTTMNIVTTGADSTLSAISDTALTTLTLAGSKHLTLSNGSGAPNLKNVTVSGSASLSANFSATALSSIDASATSGSNTVTIDGSKADYTGGSGADIVTLSAVASSHSIRVGTGADRVTLAAAPSGLNTYTSVLDAHAGMTLAFADLGTETFASAKLVLASGATFHDYADGIIAAAGNAASNGAIGWFQFGGDTFVVESRHNQGTTAGFVGGTDVIVRLVGNIDLSHATFGGSEAITLV